MLSLTDRCTYLCGYCSIPTRKSAEMSLEQLTALFRQMRDFGVARIGVWGGEPLIRKDVGEILAAAKAMGFYISVDTNGQLVAKRMDALAHADHVVISLDGRRENHDANRVPGSFDGAMEGIRTLAGRKRLWTITVLTRHSIGDIDFILDTAREYGFLASFQAIHHNELLGSGGRDMAPDDGELRRAVARLIEEKERGAPIANTVQYLRYLRGWPDFGVPMRDDQVGWLPCVAGDLFANVDTNGDLYPCSLTVGSVPTKNVLEVGFAEAFRATSRMGCSSCDASCYVEYNHLHALHPGAIRDFTRSVALKR
jgi:MoaA/NifB/PqqE/SkfB family radical SAM enzyme